MTDLFLTILSILAVMLVVVLIYIIAEYKNWLIEDEPVGSSNQKTMSELIKAYDRINIKAFNFPRIMEKISHDDLYHATHAVYKVFRSINYKNYDHRNYEKDWHSWQIGLLLLLYKRDKEFFIPDIKSAFRDDILELDEAHLKKRMNDILVRYRDEVNVKTDREHLSQDKRWSGQDVSIIFYFLSTYQHFEEKTV